MSFRPLLIASVLVLASCAYATEQQIQDVRVETPGAENAVCFMYVEGLKYKVSPPETINISKSHQDLVIDCMAPGNRRKKEFIEPTLSKKVYGDIPILPMLGWDIASQSLYKYPDIITVDFTNTPVKPEDLPAQNRPDVKQPEEYPLEEYMPGRMRMNSDRYEAPTELQRRNAPAPAGTSNQYMIETGGPSGDKGNLKAVNPSGAKSSSSSAVKAGPAYPGQ